MAMPNAKQLGEKLKKLEKLEGTLALPENATPLEKLRWDLCQKFIVYKQKKNLNQKQLAEKLKIDEAKISKILHHRIDEFTTDRLIALYQKIDPTLNVRVS